MLTFVEAFLSREAADRLLHTLREKIAWEQGKGLFGKPIPRRTAFYGDAGIRYSYSGITHVAAGWTPELAELREQVQAFCDARFNTVLLNHYRDGRDSMGLHADDEPELGRNPLIASVSLGGTRRFVLKHNETGERLEYELSHGSLLVMGGTLQHFWRHGIPKTRKPVAERINLTFRRTNAD